jgi:ribosome-associated heat shock protein Hsp15
VLRVLSFPAGRVGAPEVPTHCENLTPPENFERAAEARKERALVTPRPHDSLTRPTKQDLRKIREWLGKD